jgi:hypothetical protein
MAFQTPPQQFSSPVVPPSTPKSAPQRGKQPQSPAHYYSIPRPSTPHIHHTSISSSPLSGHVHRTSVPPSPYTGLSEKQVKKLQKAFERTDAKVQFQRDMFDMAGVPMTKDEVVGLMGLWADNKPDVRTFSRLTTQDYYLLCKSIYSSIRLNDHLLVDKVPDSIIPPSFLDMLRITRLVSSRNTEMGTRKIINLFLDVAIYLARTVFNDERLVIHHEFDTKPTEVPEIGFVSGPLDYVTSRAAGKLEMGTFLKIFLLTCGRGVDA